VADQQLAGDGLDHGLRLVAMRDDDGGGDGVDAAVPSFEAQLASVARIARNRPVRRLVAKNLRRYGQRLGDAADPRA